jgi:ABC-type antimicrobial peptide transport system permease subunit
MAAIPREDLSLSYIVTTRACLGGALVVVVVVAVVGITIPYKTGRLAAIQRNDWD